MEKHPTDLLTELINALLDANDSEDAVSRALRILGETFGWSYGAFWQMDAERRVLCCVNSWHRYGSALAEFANFSRELPLAVHADLPGQVWESGEPVWLSELTHLPRSVEAARAGLHLAFAFPIHSRRGLLGVMEFFSGEIKSPDAAFPAQVNSLGRQIGLLLEHLEGDSASRRTATLKSAQLQAALDAIVSMDHHGMVLEWNPAAEELFGYRREEVLGREMAELIIPPRLRERHRGGLADYLETGEGPIIGRRLELSALRKDGTEFPVELTVTRIPTDGPPIFTGFIRDLTERYRAAAEVRAANERASRILESITDAFFALDCGWCFTYVNHEAERLLNRKREELLGRNIWQEFPDTVDSVVHREYHRAAAEKTTVQFEAYSSAQVRWFEVQVYPAEAGLSVYFRDISKRKEAEAALRRSEERHRLLVEAMPQIVWLANREGLTTYVNQRWHEYAGISIEDTEGVGWTTAVHPEDLPELLELWQHAVRSGEVYATEARLRRGADGMFRWHLLQGLPLRDTAGQVVEWIGTATDIHDQKQAQQQAEEARQRSRLLAQQLRLITDTVPALISYIDRNFRYQFTNVAYESWFGMTREQMQGKYVWEVVGANNWDLIRPHLEAALAGQMVRYEERVRPGDGDCRWIQSTLSPLYSESGEVVGLAVLATDITERKRREEAERLLADASKLLGTSLDYEQTLQNLARLVVPRLADWCIIDLVGETGAYQRLTVEHHDPAKRGLAYELYRRYPPSYSSLEGVAPVIRSGESKLWPEWSEAEMRRLAQDEGHLHLLRELGLRSALSVPLTARGRTFGAITLVFGDSGRTYDSQDLELVQDLAGRAAVAVENARLYQEIQQANQAKDEFLATLAHELRNPLGAVSNALHVMNQANPQSATHRRAQEIALRQIEHQTRLVNDLLDVSRIQRNKIDLHLDPLDLVRIVRESLEDQRGSLERAGITLQSDLPDQPVPILGDYTRLTQVLSNLLDNSRKFTPSGGQICVRLSLLLAARQAELSLQDTGIGISPDLLPYIFDPFTQADRTLARSRGGLGLGLALVKELVELHEGTIRVQSLGPGQGTQFIITLPLRPDLPLPTAERPALPQQGTSLRVLIIEDLRDAAETLQDLLTLYGYEVRIAHSGAEGLELAHDFQPDVIICDIGLPEMSGYEVAARLRREPEIAHIRLIALTGYGTLADIEKAHQAGFDLHLTKPIHPERLQHALMEIQ